MFKTYITYKILTKSGITKKIIPYIRQMSSGTNDDVLIENVNDKGILTLNRPAALNALNLSMVKKILPVLQKWENEKSMVIVKGAGDKAFCAGGDVRAVVEAKARGEKTAEEFFKWEYTMNGVIGAFKKPYIALIDGIVMGGGVGLSVHGRYRVATERTLFAMPETRIGLFPDVGGSYFLPRLCDKLGLYLALTGHRLKGVDVLSAGIATHYVESSKLPELESELVNKCCNDDDIKKTLQKFNIPKTPDFSLCDKLDKINHCFAAPTVEGIIQSLKKDGSEWALNTVKTLCTMSPTSMKVSKKLLDTTDIEDLSLEKCLALEYKVVCHTLERKEFAEGTITRIVYCIDLPHYFAGFKQGFETNFFYSGSFFRN